MSDRNSILRRIAEVEKQLAYLLEQQEEAESILQSLQEHLKRADFTTAGTEKHPDEGHTPTAQNLSPTEKVALFLRLFRGRDDVYPKLWQNQKTGKKGYSPACSNEWVREVCDKPRVKCGECPNQVLFLTLFHHHFPGLCLADDQSISHIDCSGGKFLEG